MKYIFKKIYVVIVLGIMLFLLLILLFINNSYKFSNFDNLNYKYRNNYDVVYNFSGGIAIAKEKGKIVLINEKGEKIFSPKNYEINSILHGEMPMGNTEIFPIMYYIDNPKVKVQNEDGTQTSLKYWGLINLKGEIISKQYYDQVFYEKFGYSLFEKDLRRGLMDKNGDEVIPPIYNNLDTTDGKIFLAQKSFTDTNGDNYQKWGYISSTGSIIIPFIYDFANEFNDNVAKVMIKGNVFFINTKGEKIIDMYGDKYRIVDYNDGLFLAQNEEGKYGFLDEKLNLKIKFDYDEATIFSGYDKNGISLVKKGEKNFYINKNGIVILNVKDLFLPYSFKEGLARQENLSSGTGNKWEVINTKGDIIIGSGQLADKKGGFYNLLSGFYDGYAIITDGSKYGYISNNGKILHKPIFTRYTYFYNGVAEVELEGVRYYLYKDGFMSKNLYSDGVKKYH